MFSKILWVVGISILSFGIGLNVSVNYLDVFIVTSSEIKNTIDNSLFLMFLGLSVITIAEVKKS